jgi:rRNA maturation endonuclease Nob1
MYARPPDNLPGSSIGKLPDRPNSKKCPSCKRIFVIVKIKIKNNRMICPHCGAEVAIKKSN